MDWSSFLLFILPLKFVTSSVFIRRELVACDPSVKDPAKPVDGNLTSCSQRLFLSLKLIQDEKLKKKYQYVIVDSAYDVSTGEEIRLLRPLVLKIIQQPATVAYPFKYIFAANNKPYETTLNKRDMSNYTGCDPSATYQPACQKYEHLDPNRGKNGKVLTQGFCCPCEVDDKSNQRENLVCKEKTAPVPDAMDLQSTTHCLRFDPVWYSVNALKSPIFHHKIGIGIYVADGGSKAERTWKPLLPKYSNFVLGTHQKRAEHEKIVASYTEITKKGTAIKFPLDHHKQVVLIPQPHISDEDYIPPQTKQGPEQFLVVNKTMVDQTGGSCDKIGVSYDAFEKQENRCHAPVNSCLKNTIQDMWLQDMKRTANDTKGEYFLSSFGNLSDPSVVEEPKSDPLLLFDMEFEHISHVYIDINADLIQTTIQVLGEIVQVVSMSDGKITEIEVHVHNRGLVTAIFATGISNCSSSAVLLGKHSKEIDPYSSATFLSKLKHAGNKISSDIHTCTVELFDKHGKRIADRVVTFQPLHRCFCIGECSCQCTSQKNWNKCHLISKRDSKAAGIEKTLHKKKTNHVKDITSGTIILIIILLILLCLGVLKCVVTIVKDIINTRRDGMYKDIRPDLRAYGLRRICLDIWFFFYCPCWMVYLCISGITNKCNHEAKESSTPPEQKISEVFETLKEDKGKFAVSDSEDEDTFRPIPTETDVSSDTGLSLRPATDDITSSIIPAAIYENENNSRRRVPSEESVVEKKSHPSAENIAVAESQSEISEEPAKVSSSTSILSKKAIELKFRKQKEHLNSILRDTSESVSPSRPGSIRIVASEITQRTNEPDYPDDLATQPDQDEDPLTDLDRDVLNVFTTPTRLVYLNHSGKTSLLHKSGEMFSLCGTLKKSGLYFKYTLGHYTTQLFWNKKGKIKRLTTPLPISGKNFVRVMTGAQALREITLEPKYPCLNYVAK